MCHVQWRTQLKLQCRFCLLQMLILAAQKKKRKKKEYWLNIMLIVCLCLPFMRQVNLGRALTWKGGMGMYGGQDLLFTPLPPFFRSVVAAWFTSLDPHFEQKYQILTPMNMMRKICQKIEEFSALQPKFGSNFSSKPSKCWKFSVP